MYYTNFQLSQCVAIKRQNYFLWLCLCLYAMLKLLFLVLFHFFFFYFISFTENWNMHNRYRILWILSQKRTTSHPYIHILTKMEFKHKCFNRYREWMIWGMFWWWHCYKRFDFSRFLLFYRNRNKKKRGISNEFHVLFLFSLSFLLFLHFLLICVAFESDRNVISLLYYM